MVCRLCGIGRLAEVREMKECLGGEYLFTHSICDYCESDQISHKQSVINKEVSKLKKMSC